MAESISGQEIIQGLEKIEYSLWKTLLENPRFALDNVSQLTENQAYMAADQRVKKTDRFDPEQSLKDKQITSLYDRINQMLEAIPAIQIMKDSKNNWGISTASKDFTKLKPEIQESVQAVLERARLKLDAVRMEYASFGETSGDQAEPNDEEKQSNRQLGLQLRELLSIVPATSLSLEAPLRRSDGVWARMEEVTRQAAQTFGGVFDKLKTLIGMGNDRTQ